jgi:ATP-binding protein involved in chromosome partitioning
VSPARTIWGMSSPLPTREQVLTALAGVNDPEIGQPITELGMVKSIEIGDDGLVAVGVYLTVAGCPMRDTITARVTGAVSPLAGVSGVQVELDVMSEDQRKDLQTKIRGGAPERVIPFAQPSSLTKVYAIVSGKGGVGKSSVTVNLAAALAAAGHRGPHKGPGHDHAARREGREGHLRGDAQAAGPGRAPGQGSHLAPAP